jgi:hypothetical protein
MNYSKIMILSDGRRPYPSTTISNLSESLKDIWQKIESGVVNVKD